MLFWIHIVAFAGATALCFLALLRARDVTDKETRIGLVALLATSGGWALSYVGYLIAPTEQLTDVVYLIGLIVGFATVGWWLYQKIGENAPSSRSESSERVGRG